MIIKDPAILDPAILIRGCPVPDPTTPRRCCAHSPCQRGRHFLYYVKRTVLRLAPRCWILQDPIPFSRVLRGNGGVARKLRAVDRAACAGTHCDLCKKCLKTLFPHSFEPTGNYVEGNCKDKYTDTKVTEVPGECWANLVANMVCP